MNGILSDRKVRQHYHDLVRSDVIPFVLPRGGTLLDVGGGIGGTAIELKDLGLADRVGVIDLVRPQKDRPGLDFRYAGDLGAEDPLATAILQEGPFQTILCLDILEHLIDPWTMVRRLHSALAAGGQLIASIPNVRNYQVLLPLLFRGEWNLADAGLLDRTHLRFFVRGSAAELMTSSGLHLDLIVGKPSSRRRDKLIRKLSMGSLDEFLVYQWIIRATRVD